MCLVDAFLNIKLHYFQVQIKKYKAVLLQFPKFLSGSSGYFKQMHFLRDNQPYLCKNFSGAVTSELRPGLV